MWNLQFAPPLVIQARVLTRLPDSFREKCRREWSDANKPGQEIDSFLEGPAFDGEGNLFVTDIPCGRVFRISPRLEWTLVAQYDGWPNGAAFHRDGSLWITDYRRGLVRIAAAELRGAGAKEPVRPQAVLGHRNSESFKGLNDLVFSADGTLFFTDQGQTGLHDPTGRVYRLSPDGRLDVVMSGVPSPNGVALDASGKVLYVAVTRANQVWRGPLLPDHSITKVGAFRTFFGASGPDGLAVGAQGRLVVCHASLGGAFLLDARGGITHFIRTPVGSTVTNCAYRPGTSKLVLTESETGTLLEADMPAE